MKYIKGKLYWFYEGYKNTGRILFGELVYVSSKNIAKIKLGKDHYFNIGAEQLSENKETLMARKEKKLKGEK